MALRPGPSDSRPAGPGSGVEGGQVLGHLEGLGFAIDWGDRVSYWREDPARVGALRAQTDARAVLIARDMPVLHKSGPGLDALLPMSEIEALGGAEVEALLGLRPDGAPVFAAMLPDGAV